MLVVLVLSLTYYGATLRNRISSWWYERGTEQAHEEIEKAKGEAAQAKAVAEEALRELAAEKVVTAKLTKEREEREKILADRTLNSDEKLRKYEETLSRTPTVSAPASSIDELCARARAAGIACE